MFLNKLPGTIFYYAAKYFSNISYFYNDYGDILLRLLKMGTKIGFSELLDRTFFWTFIFVHFQNRHHFFLHIF